MSRSALAAAGHPADPPPGRIVHVGVGAFARAHQAWYTAHAADAAAWGIIGFTGRSADMAERLTAQDGLYTLVARGPEGDTFEVIPNLVAVHDGADIERFVASLNNPEVSIVTLTITEPGYQFAEPLRHQLERLRASFAGASVDSTVDPGTALGRLLLGLEARRRAELPPPALVSCDNLPDNGGVLRGVLLRMSELIAPDLVDWLEHSVSFVSTSVDRITPRLSPSDAAAINALTGWNDAAPVLTEPFSDWKLSGEFNLGMPDWQSAGAALVPDIAPFELRKLWMLNGAHTMLACLGRLRGHRTVSEAIADPTCRASVELLWRDIEPHVPGDLDLVRYRESLIHRFENGRIVHSLEQIASDSLTKLRVRVAPVAELQRRSGAEARGCATAIAAWIATIERGVGTSDAHAALIADTGAQTAPRAGLLRLVSPVLAEDIEFRRLVDDLVREHLLFH